MGAWGWGPFDNDSARDLVFRASSIVWQTVWDTRDKMRAGRAGTYGYSEARAAIEVIAALDKAGYKAFSDELQDAREVLGVMVADPQFGPESGDYEKLRSQMRSRLKWLDKRLAEERVLAKERKRSKGPKRRKR